MEGSVCFAKQWLVEMSFRGILFTYTSSYTSTWLHNVWIFSTSGNFCMPFSVKEKYKYDDLAALISCNPYIIYLHNKLQV